MKNYICMGFTLTNQYSDTLNKLFKGIKVDGYTWHVAYSQNFYSKNDNRGEFLPNGIYGGIEFKETIENSEYYILFIALYGVPNGLEFDIDAVGNYDDYLKSNAEIAMFAADGLVDLFAKDSCVLDMIYQNCKENDGDFIDFKERDIELFTSVEENGRTGFYV